MSEGCHKRPSTECQNETKHYPKMHMPALHLAYCTINISCAHANLFDRQPSTTERIRRSRRGGPIIGAHSEYIFDHFCSSVGAMVTNDALQMR